MRSLILMHPGTWVYEEQNSSWQAVYCYQFMMVRVAHKHATEGRPGLSASPSDLSSFLDT